jgi:hypothetical protein
MPNPDRKDFVNERFDHYLALEAKSRKHEHFIINRLKQLQYEMGTNNLCTGNNSLSSLINQAYTEAGQG